MIATDLLPLLEAEARERQVATLKQNQKADTVVATLPQRSEGKAREQAAKLAGASPRHVAGTGEGRTSSGGVVAAQFAPGGRVWRWPIRPGWRRNAWNDRT